MIPIQPLLIVFLALLVWGYLVRFRSMFWDRLIVIGISAVAVGLVSYPDLSNQIAKHLGVSRGADLIFYLTIPGLLFMILLLYAKATRQEEHLALLTRELALLRQLGQAFLPADVLRNDKTAGKNACPTESI